MTEKLFYKDSHRKEFRALVLSCRKRAGFETNGAVLYEIELDRTVFFPEGGGQYGDTGMLGQVRVVDVKEKEGCILHIADGPLDVGTEVRGCIDWEERFMKMQQHTGEHIVSGLVNRRFGYDNVGFHLGSEDCTMDFNGEMTPRELEEIEWEANRAVWENIPVQTLYPSREERVGMVYRSKIEIGDGVRIIRIPGYDSCACCAPHVSRTGEIGLIKLTRSQRYKGGVRVTMLCGVRALADYHTKQEQAKAVSAMLCSRENEISSGVEQMRAEVAALKAEIKDREKRLVACAAGNIPPGPDPVCIFTDDLQGESMRFLANSVMESGHLLCAVFRRQDTSGPKASYNYVIGSREGELSGFARSFHQNFPGRGGGKGRMIQGTVTGAKERIEAWIMERGKSSDE